MTTTNATTATIDDWMMAIQFLAKSPEDLGLVITLARLDERIRREAIPHRRRCPAGRAS